MLTPKRLKYKKPHKVPHDRTAKRGTEIAFGKYALQAVTSNYVTERQIEACRIAITRYLKRNGKLWIRIFPQLPITKKPLEVRMGKGKGSIDHYAAVVRKGMILFELDQVTEDDAKEALRLGMHKLPVKCKIIQKDEVKNV